MTRRRKLDTPEEIHTVCEDYYLTESSISQIASRYKTSPGTINRVLKENGKAFRSEHTEEIQIFKYTHN